MKPTRTQHRLATLPGLNAKAVAGLTSTRPSPAGRRARPEGAHDANARMSAQLAILRHGLGHNLGGAICCVRMIAANAIKEAMQNGHGTLNPDAMRSVIKAVNWVARVVADATASDSHLNPKSRTTFWGVKAVNAAVEFHPAIIAGRATVEVIGPFGLVCANPFLYESCIHALLDNAVKYVRRRERPHIRIRGRFVGNTLRLMVEDNGVGLTPQQRRGLFRAGRRFHRHLGIRGTGRGLAYVRSVVRQMGGTVGARSAP